MEKTRTIKELFEEFLRCRRDDQVDFNLFQDSEAWRSGWHKGKGFFSLLEATNYDYASAGLTKSEVLNTVRVLYSSAITNLISNNQERNQSWADRIINGHWYKENDWFHETMDGETEAWIPPLHVLVSRFDNPEFLGFTSEQIEKATSEAQKILKAQPVLFPQL